MNMTAKNFLYGLLTGIAVSILLLTAFKSAGNFGSPSEQAAALDGEAISISSLREKLAPQLVFAENDEYQILLSGAKQWLETRLLEKEARSTGVTVNDLYRKNVWEKIQLSQSDVLNHYQKNRELYSAQPFEKIAPLLFNELRQREYDKLLQDYTDTLKQKYHAKIDLKKPGTFVQGLGTNLVVETGPAAVEAPAAAPTPAPSVPAIAGPPMLIPATAPIRGPKQAPVTIVEYADFHCGFCKKGAATMKEVAQKYPTQVRIVFRHHPLSTTPGQGSFLTHEASVCAQDQGKFWEFYDGVFAFPTTPQKADLDQIAKNIGLNTEKFQQCLSSGKNQAFLKSELEESTRKGVQGTPTFYVNEQAVPGAFPFNHFQKMIESILNPGKVQPPPSAAPPSPAAPPAIVSFNDLDGRPSLGPKKAPVTIVEFSDFHCPFCSRVVSTLDQIHQNYPDKVRIIWRHYPLAMHAGADRTHEASECANEQGKFWEYYRKLFANQQILRDESALVRLAEQSGLNKKKFEKCFTSGKYKDQVQKDVAKGNESGVRGTPAFFVNGKLMSGARPYESFEQAIKEELSKSK